MDPTTLRPELRRKDPDSGREVLRFQQQHWLSEEQIHSFFSRTYAKQKNKVAKGKDPTPDQVADASMRFEEYHSQQQVVHQEASDSISCNHPIVASDVDICSLADNIASSATLKQSRIQDYDIKELKDILHQIGATVSAGNVSAGK